MNLLRLTIVVAVGAAASVLPGGRALAKTADFIVTGGDLGEGAYHFLLEDGLDFFREDRIVAAPAAPTPGPHYDLYTSSWPLDLAPRLAAGGGPDLVYYPEARLLHAMGVRPHWLRLGEKEATFLDAAIARAASLQAEASLPGSVIEAAARARGFFDRRAGVAVYSFGQPGALPVEYECPLSACSGRRAPAADLAQGLVQTISFPPKPASPGPDPLLLLTLRGPSGPDGYWEGYIGYYGPPSGGLPGRFWSPSLRFAGAPGFDSAPYWETTPAFDAAARQVVAEAKRRWPIPAPPAWGGEPAAGRRAGESDAFSRPEATAMVLAAAALLSLLLFRRQRRA